MGNSITTASVRKGSSGVAANTFVGVHTFMGAGLWHKSAYVWGSADWEQILSTTKTNANSSDNLAFDSSYDFFTNTAGVSVRYFKEPLSTVLSTLPDEADTTITVDGPGMTALLSLLSLGTLAFVAPRLRKK
jgi:hypothetical protein